VDPASLALTKNREHRFIGQGKGIFFETEVKRTTGGLEVLAALPFFRARWIILLHAGRLPDLNKPWAVGITWALQN
jgi:hypothetical protein